MKQLFEPLLLGMTTGTYCVLSCAPVTLPYLLSDRLSRRQNNRNVTLFLFGRFIGYILFGAALGALGGFLSEMAGFSVQWKLSGLSGILIGLLMLSAGFIYNFPHLKICQSVLQNRKAHMGALSFGIFTGLSVCPPFISAAARAFQSGTVLSGMFFFLLFFIGTSIYFLPLLGLPFLRKQLAAIRPVARISMIFLGAYYLVFHGILVLVSNS